MVTTTGLSKPRSLAFDGSGNLYIADTLNDRIVKVAAAGGAQTTLGFTGLSDPAGVAVDSGGNVYAADTNNNRVVKLPAGGGAQVVLPFVGLSGAFSVAVDGVGNVYATDTFGNEVLKLPSGGGAQTTVPFTGLSAPGGLAVNPRGDLFVADTVNDRVLKMPALSSTQELVPTSGLSLPFALAVGIDEEVFVPDFGNDRAIRAAYSSPLGTPVSAGQVDLAFTGLDQPLGIAISPDGWVYVADSAHNRIVRVPVRAGMLRVVTSPAVQAGIEIDGAARDEWGLTWPQLSPKLINVCFDDVPGFETPACQDTTVTRGTTAAVTGTFVPKGFLRVLTSPALPSTITVDGVPRNDWGMWAEVPAGTYEVCFGKVAGWNVPSCRSVAVTAGTTASTTGTFTANAAATGPAGSFGYLRVTTSPAVNALITVDGQWRDNWGLTWVKVPVGSHEVCFGRVLGWRAPLCQTVNVTNGATTTVAGSYGAQGYLRVQTDPPSPVGIYVFGLVRNAWGMWSEVYPAEYTVCFGHRPGWQRPPCQVVDVTALATTTVTGEYLPRA